MIIWADALTTHAQPPNNGGAYLFPEPKVSSRMLPLEVDRVMAPIALYPDALLSEVLMAATYPIEVKEASNWAQQPANAKLSGQELVTALQRQPWDPSVKSLVALPSVLGMMAENPRWTEQAGDLFVVDQADVMDTVQWLREKAVATGYFRASSAEVLTVEDDSVILKSPERDFVYVPVCDLSVVYGAWPDRDYPPFEISRSFPGISGNAHSCGWIGEPVAVSLWNWSNFDWNRHRLIVDRAHFLSLGGNPANLSSDNVWRHNAPLRKGVT